MKIKTIHMQETDSTNRYLREYVPEEGEDITVALTEYQYAGKGQGSNKWESERGQNLLFSILVHPDGMRADGQFVISMAVSTVIRDALASLTDEEITVKWPNDIYAGDKKICGILIENRIVGNMIKDCIIGIGINVNQTCFASDAPNPVSLKTLCGREQDRERILSDIIDRLCVALKGMGNVGCAESIRREYKMHLFRREGYHWYSDRYGSFEAEIHDVEDDGHLLLRDRGGEIRQYAFKEVKAISLFQ